MDGQTCLFLRIAEVCGNGELQTEAGMHGRERESRNVAQLEFFCFSLVSGSICLVHRKQTINPLVFN